jgi:hypothetical protein
MPVTVPSSCSSAGAGRSGSGRVSSFVVVAPTGATATDANAIDDAVNTRMTLTDRRRMISFYPIFPGRTVPRRDLSIT